MYRRRTPARVFPWLLACSMLLGLLLTPGCGTVTPPPSVSPGGSGAAPASQPEESPVSDSGADASSSSDSGPGPSPQDPGAGEAHEEEPDPGSSQPGEAPASSSQEGQAASSLADAQGDPPPDTGEVTTYVYTPWAAGTVVYGNEYVTIDVSNAAEGYCHVKYTGGGSARIKVLITQYGGNQYQYNLNTAGSYEVFPFSVGSGTYSIGVYQNVGGSSYAALYSTDISVSLRSGTLPFLYANQQVNFWSGSAAVAAGGQLTQAAQDDLDRVSKVYNYVMQSIQYDYNKAATVQSGYIPAVDNILATGYGICFDYAAVMAAMLRTQNIPTKVVVGYAGDIYHAWVSIYITDVGWVNNLVYFDGQSWQRMDPTFADNGNQSADIMAFINNGANYSPIYYY